MEPILFILTIIFAGLLFIVCGKKGFRSLGALVLTIAALVWVVTPLILHGHSPLLVTFLVSLPVLIAIVYLTEGFTLLSHISLVAVILNFILITLLTLFAVYAGHFTGLVSGDASFLGFTGVDLQQLLAAGIMLGTLGILTEMVVTQVATVIEFRKASPHATTKEIYVQSYAVGIVHLGSIINTLFLVYAGVSLPLLIIYAGGNSSLHAALDYEPLASEIARVLVGTIGLIIAMPTSTWLAVWWVGRNTTKDRNH